MIIETFPVGLLQCNCTILGDEQSGEAIVIDPGDEAPKILKRLEARGLRAKAILITHTHLDHVGSNQAMRDAGARIMLHEKDLPLYDNLEVQASFIGLDTPDRAEVDEYIHQGDVVSLGASRTAVEVLHTPGHTPGSCCFFVGSENLLLSGDTLFAGGVGRTDLWGGDYDTEIRSIRDRLLPLPDSTRVIAGHGPDTTIVAERRSNPFLTSRGL